MHLIIAKNMQVYNSIWIEFSFIKQMNYGIFTYLKWGINESKKEKKNENGIK